MTGKIDFEGSVTDAGKTGERKGLLIHGIIRSVWGCGEIAGVEKLPASIPAGCRGLTDFETTYVDPERLGPLQANSDRSVIYTCKLTLRDTG